MPSPKVSRCATDSSDDVAAYVPILAAEATDAGVTLKNLSIDLDPNEGLIVDAKLALTAREIGEQREAQVRWATIGVLTGLRAYCEEEHDIAVNLYRLSIENADGNALITYVVDPAARITRVWSAGGVAPSWG